MIAVDTNVLVYAHRGDSAWHERAAGCVKSLAESSVPWAIPWPCIHEFFGIVTHPRIYTPPSTRDEAIDQIDAWLESPSLTLLAEGLDHWRVLQDLLRSSKVVGPIVHDARIAAICIQHSIHELWSADRDFGRFTQVAVKNPLV